MHFWIIACEFEGESVSYRFKGTHSDAIESYKETVDIGAVNVTLTQGFGKHYVIRTHKGY